MSRFTGQPLDKIHEDSERDFYMDPEAALRYGIIDSIARPAASAGGGSEKQNLQLNSVIS